MGTISNQYGGRLAPLIHTHAEEHRRLIADAANQALAGNLNNRGSFTLAAGGTTTTVTDTRAGADTVILWTPTTANAATAMDKVYVSTRNKGSFIVTHDNTADVDRTFHYALFG